MRAHVVIPVLLLAALASAVVSSVVFGWEEPSVWRWRLAAGGVVAGLLLVLSSGEPGRGAAGGRGRHRWRAGAGAVVAVVALVQLSAAWQAAGRPEVSPSLRGIAEGWWQVRVLEGCRPALAPCSVLVGRVLVSADGSRWLPVEARWRVYLESPGFLPQRGDVLLVRGAWRGGGQRAHRFAYDMSGLSNRRGLAGTVFVREPPVLLTAGSGPGWWLDGLRLRMERVIVERARRLDAPGAGALLTAMVTGTRAGVESRTREAFARTGLAHVLAVSGLHLGLIAAGLYALLRWLVGWAPFVLRRVPAQVVAAWLTIPWVAGYVVLVGAPTSAVRAGVMACAVLVAVGSGRASSSLHALCVSLLGMVIVSPAWVSDLGFQLSAAATASLVGMAALAPAAGEGVTDAVTGGSGLVVPAWLTERGRLTGPDGLAGAGGWLDSWLRSWLGLWLASTAAGLAVPGGWGERAAAAAARAARRVTTPVYASLMVTTVSSLATAPFLAWYMGSVPLLGHVGNLVVAPVLTLLALPVGLVGALVSVAGASVDASLAGLGGVVGGGAPLAAGGQVGAGVMAAGELVASADSVPGGGWGEAAGGWMVSAALRAVVASLWLVERIEPWAGQEWVVGRPLEVGLLGWCLVAAPSPWLATRPGRVACVVLLGVALVWGDWWLRQPSASQVEVHAIPSGQGDCTLVRIGRRDALLIDVPGRDAEDAAVAQRLVLPYVRGLGLARVRVVVSTHGHVDHMGGLSAVLGPLRVEQLWSGDASMEHASDLTLRQASKRAGVAWRVLHDAHREVRWGPTRLEVAPSGGGWGLNDGSLVLRMEHGAVRFLFTGDIEAGRERALVDAGIPLQAHYLKVPHHASRTSSTDAFLDRVLPAVAVAHLAGGNRHGFPHREVMERYASRGVPVWRTDQGEAVVVRSDGARLERVAPRRLLRWPGRGG